MAGGIHYMTILNSSASLYVIGTATIAGAGILYRRYLKKTRLQVQKRVEYTTNLKKKWWKR